MKAAVVTAIGSFSADIVIKNLIELGLKVIGCDIYPAEWIADSSNVSVFYQVPLATQEGEYIEEILTICRKEAADGLIVLTDAEVDVWNRNRNKLEEAGVTLCLSPEETITVCRDKMKFYEFLSERGIGNPIPTARLDSMTPESIPYPAVVKPYNGRSSQGLCYLHSQEETKRFLAGCEAVNYVVQPFYKGNVITVDVVRQADPERSAAVCRRELLRTLNGAGTSVMVFSSPVLEELCKESARALGITGCVNFEFIEGEDGTYSMLECNPRFSGGVEFSCMAGYDFVSNHVRCFMEEEIDAQVAVTEMYIARKYEEYVTKVLEKEGTTE
ncbi:ATP-grasp domain-containing protein [Lacrimispora sp.]|uniref:ATP-grasp domain-containing protein n=1 Tax=Lacrimispora sp. TaxID=2719234 RepID=UPI0029E7088E|nr:carbamoyl-phosphate synthase large subunit [Lacrimispora sp.]